MAENDIYNNEGKYLNFKQNLAIFSQKPSERAYKDKFRSKYYCKNKANLNHFKALFKRFEAKDLSYIRRNRLLGSMKLICHASEKNLKDLKREDIDQIVAFMHTAYKSPKSKSDFIKDIKYLWKLLFPEKDEKGRLDETIVPYPVRHLSPKIDKSREKRKNDRLTFEEFEGIVDYFSYDPRMQFYLMLSLESLGRPQEILYTRLKDIELYDNYAKIYISEHGKEGTGFMQVIDSYPYLIKWLGKHPKKKDQDSFIFINTCNDKKNYGKQLCPKNINKMLKLACKHLKISKPITAYSLKRNGVTFRRIRGDSDVEIQHVARWTSTKQLKTYDHSEQEDALKIALVKKGLLKDEAYKQYEPKVKECLFCNHRNPFNIEICDNCKRPLDRDKILQLEKKKEKDYSLMKEELETLKAQVDKQSNTLNDFFKNEEMQKLFKLVYKLQKQLKEKI